MLFIVGSHTSFFEAAANSEDTVYKVHRGHTAVHYLNTSMSKNSLAGLKLNMALSRLLYSTRDEAIEIVLLASSYGGHPYPCKIV